VLVKQRQSQFGPACCLTAPCPSSILFPLQFTPTSLSRNQEKLVLDVLDWFTEHLVSGAKLRQRAAPMSWLIFWKIVLQSGSSSLKFFNLKSFAKVFSPLLCRHSRSRLVNCYAVWLMPPFFWLLIFRVHFDIWWIALALTSKSLQSPLPFWKYYHSISICFTLLCAFCLCHYNEVSITSFVSVAAIFVAPQNVLNWTPSQRDEVGGTSFSSFCIKRNKLQHLPNAGRNSKRKLQQFNW